MADRTRNGGGLASVSRRRVLGAVGAVALAGLAGCSDGREEVVIETTLTLIDTDSGDEKTLFDAERDDLDPGGYVWWEFTLDEELDVEYQVEVVEGETVNAYVLEPAAYEQLSDDEEDFEAVSGTISEEVSSATERTTLSSGDYYLVVMNADILPENA